MIVGSLSYRISMPEMQTKPGLHDIDLATFSSKGEDPRFLVKPNIRKRFVVEHVTESPLGYYYRLRHRATDMELDVFTRDERPNKLFRIGGLPVRVASAESTLFHGLVHLLMLEKHQRAISKKKPYNANQLWRAVDQDIVLEFFDNKPDEFRSYIPEQLLGKSNAELIQYALSLKARGRRIDSEKPNRKPSIITLHGISASPLDDLKHGPKKSERKSLKQRFHHKFYDLKMSLKI